MKKYSVLAVVIIVAAGITVFVFLSRSNGQITGTKGDEPEIMKLPMPIYDSLTSVEKALLKRRSVRDYTGEPLQVSEISQLLWAAQGITAQGFFRTAPSAGALYPLELYIVAGNVSGITSGIYKYIPLEHGLVRIAGGDKRSSLSNAALGQSCVRNCSAAIVISAVYERVTGKYGERGIQYVHMEAGHAAQNVYLQAVSLQLGTVVVGAFRDNEVKNVIRMNDDEKPLYIMPVGHKASQ